MQLRNVSFKTRILDETIQGTVGIASLFLAIAAEVLIFLNPSLLFCTKIVNMRVSIFLFALYLTTILFPAGRKGDSRKIVAKGEVCIAQ